MGLIEDPKIRFQWSVSLSSRRPTVFALYLGRHRLP